MTESTYERLSRDPKMRRLLAQEQLILEVTESILAAMEGLGLTQADLARKLGKSRGFISQLLSGERNMTLRTLGDLCWGLDLNPAFRLGTSYAVGELSFSLPDEVDYLFHAPGFIGENENVIVESGDRSLRQEAKILDGTDRWNPAA